MTQVTKKGKGKSRLAKAEAIVQTQVEMIDDHLTDLEKMLRPYNRIKEEIDKLRAARRALLGGSRITGGGGNKVRQEDVIEYLEKHPGSLPMSIAEALGSTQPVISSHLYRGRDERFISKDKRWWLRNPKEGLDTADDIEEDD